MSGNPWWKVPSTALRDVLRSLSPYVSLISLLMSSFRLFDGPPTFVLTGKPCALMNSLIASSDMPSIFSMVALSALVSLLGLSDSFAGGAGGGPGLSCSCGAGGGGGGLRRGRGLSGAVSGGCLVFVGCTCSICASCGGDPGPCGRPPPSGPPPSSSWLLLRLYFQSTGAAHLNRRS